MFEPHPPKFTEMRFHNRIQRQHNPQPNYIPSTRLTQETLRSATGYARRGSRSESSTSQGAKPEFVQAWVNDTLGSSTSPLSYVGSPAMPLNPNERSSRLQSTLDQTFPVRDGCFVVQDSPENHFERLSSHPRELPESEPLGASRSLASPRKRDDKTLLGDLPMRQKAESIDNNDPILVSSETDEESDLSHFECTHPRSPRPSPRIDANHPLFLQESIVLYIHQLCHNAARHYWQMIRPRPQLNINIPSPRAVRRTAPYPERQQQQRSNAHQSRNYHDPRRVLPWTRDSPRHAFSYSDTFEGLIWRISEQEWEQAAFKSREWSKESAHAERFTAVRRMSRLYEWAQTVIEAVERVTVDKCLLDRVELTDMLLAARDLAVWLLAEHAKREIQEVWGKVMALRGEGVE